MKSPTLQVAPGRSPDFAALDRPFVTPALLAAYCAPSHCQHTPRSSALDLADRLINDRATSAWMRAALVHNLGRDLVDAANDVELLLSVISARLEEMQGGAK